MFSVYYNSKKNITSLQAIKPLKNNLKTYSRQRALQFTFLSIQKIKGSMTIEASFIMPIFLFFVLFCIQLFNMLMIKDEISFALNQTTDAIVRDVIVYQQDKEEHEIHNTAIVALASTKIGSYLKKPTNFYNILKGGKTGILLLGSCYDKDSTEILLKAKVIFCIKIPLLGVYNKVLEFNTRQKTYCGYDYKKDEKKEYVYITKYGEVYHTSEECTHIKLSITEITKNDLDSKKYKSYVACELCCKEEIPINLYITAQGGRYHTTLDCGALKRMVLLVNKDEVQDRRICSRCAKRK